MAKKKLPLTPLHITVNTGTATVNLCGEARKQTYRTVTDGTAHRFVSRFFVKETHLTDQMLCQACLVEHQALPAPEVPALLNLFNL